VVSEVRHEIAPGFLSEQIAERDLYYDVMLPFVTIGLCSAGFYRVIQDVTIIVRGWIRKATGDDFQRELDHNQQAQEFFMTLNSVNRYAILFRIHLPTLRY